MSLLIFTSTVDDGTMKSVEEEATTQKNRKCFLSKNGLDITSSCLVSVSYSTSEYCTYSIVDESQAGVGMTRKHNIFSDSLFTCSKQISLFLPLADCIGAVLYDHKNSVLGMAHLGRHNIEQDGGVKNIEFMKSNFNSNPEDIMIHLSPAAGKEAYPLFACENKGLHEAVLEQLLQAGILKKNITIDDRDTTADDMLFSHSNFLAGSQKTDGRHAIVAIMR